MLSLLLDFQVSVVMYTGSVGYCYLVLVGC